jgi:hypothetical protein
MENEADLREAIVAGGRTYYKQRLIAFPLGV